MKRNEPSAYGYQAAMTPRQKMEMRRKTAEEIKANEGIRNIFVSFEDGGNVLVYTNQTTIGERDIKEWAELVTGNKVLEAYHVPQAELQYYCIDGRVWIDTEEKANKIIETIKNGNHA